ncbi:hypothetical protein AB0C88_34310 [Streptomyces chartreusis]|uniref:hypothetical protein n=1 Tax=Streptomyces chartreusis TaxID=1969 RepID=UPI0033D06D74
MHDKEFYARHPGERETRCPIFTLPHGQTGPAPPSAGQLSTVPSPVRVKPESPPLMVLMLFQSVPVQD